MAKKSALLGGRTVKVENRSGFDKSFLNLLTTQVGTITPIMKKLVIPSSGRCKIAVHAELPPLAADTFLRTHLKLEAFYCPLRLLDGSFESWFSGEPLWDEHTGDVERGVLSRGLILDEIEESDGDTTYHHYTSTTQAFSLYGPGTLTDYFDVRLPIRDSQYGKEVGIPYPDELELAGCKLKGMFVNLLPYTMYHLLYDCFYRNKSVSLQGFMRRTRDSYPQGIDIAAYLPYEATTSRYTVILGGPDIEFVDASDINDYLADVDKPIISFDNLQNGHQLYQLRQRNFGDDYFTAARPTAQAGQATYVQTDANGRFTISSLRVQNAMEEFRENQGYATPDYIQTNTARYGVGPTGQIAQRPVLLASADYPMFTKSVEQTTPYSGEQGSEISQRNPFVADGYVGASAGKASANAQGFSFDFDVKEPGYIMVMATLVPEANYSTGVSRDMRNFIYSGDLSDLPCSLLEHVGDEPIKCSELSIGHSNAFTSNFGFVQRFLWHKAGDCNQVHGLFRKGMDLEAFAPQREFDSTVGISSSFLEIPISALDDVAAVKSGISQYGVMLDCAIELFVSEPLSESALPALVNPASEHGKSVYLYNGGSKLA